MDLATLKTGLHGDFETRSACDLRKGGPWVYGEHWSTSPLCFAFALADGPVKLWWPGMPVPPELVYTVENNLPFIAHNAGFERAIMTTIMGPRYGWPIPKLENWACTAAMAAAMALPRGLDDAAAVMGVSERKDKEGHSLMLRMCRPRTKTQVPCKACGSRHCDHPDEFKWEYTWWDDDERMQKLGAYCMQDVVVERALLHVLHPLPPAERRIWLHDMMINEVGVQVDTEFARKASVLVSQVTTALNSDLATATSDWAKTTNQVQKMKVWLELEGLKLDSLRKDVLADYLTKDLDGRIREILELRQEGSKSSTAKLNALLNRTCSDGRIRDNLMYHGASTGRWCLTGDHEVLTPGGWVRLDQWLGGAIACWSPDGDIEFALSRPNSFPFEGELHALDTVRIHQLSTPEHIVPLDGGGAARVDALPSRARIPITGRLHPLGMSEAELRVCVMVQADAHYSDDCLRLHFKKARKIFRCRHLLTWAGIPFRETPDAKSGTTLFSIRYAAAPKWLLDFKHKTFPWSWLWCAPGDVLFEELELWDGYRGGPSSIQYSTTNAQNAHFIQAKAHLSGLSCRLHVKDRRNCPDNWADSYVCDIWLCPGAAQLRKENFGREPFSGVVYCPSTPTGFFVVRRHGSCWITGNSGRGFQPQNLPRPQPEIGPYVDRAIELISGGITLPELRQHLAVWEEEHNTKTRKPDQPYFTFRPLDVVSTCLRPCLIAAPGKELVVADYSAIEARGVAWLAGAKKLLGVFERGEDPYLYQACLIYGVPQGSFNKDDHPNQRQRGKTTVLGCGYQMGWNKFQASCEKERVFLSDAEAQMCVTSYREGNPEIPELWKNLQNAAFDAVNTPGLVTKVSGGKIMFVRSGTWLYMRLPNGKLLYYADPKIVQREMPWSDERTGEKARKWCVSFMAVDSFTHRWKRQYGYGGLWAENAVQGLCRNLLAEGMERLELFGYPLVLTVHDEDMSEVPIGYGAEFDTLVKGKARPTQFEQIICEVPPWAAGFPIDAEGWRGPRYKK